MSQYVTDDLQKWIHAQTDAGHSREAVLDAMLKAGWSATVAGEALEITLQAREQAKTASRLGLVVVASPHGPEPSLSGSPLYLELGDRRVHVIAAMQQPRVVILGNFLSDEECDAIVDAARPRMARSLTVETKTGGEEVNADRTSNGMFFGRGESELIARVEARLSRLTNWPVDNGEGIQVLHYKPGAEYKPHHDYFDPREPGTSVILQRGGQRVGTVVMYLNDCEQGGGTSFPESKFTVAPRKGNAVFFAYPKATPASKTLHGGAPVIAGEKWVATKWLREREFN